MVRPWAATPSCISERGGRSWTAAGLVLFFCVSSFAKSQDGELLGSSRRAAACGELQCHVSRTRLLHDACKWLHPQLLHPLPTLCPLSHPLSPHHLCLCLSAETIFISCVSTSLFLPTLSWQALATCVETGSLSQCRCGQVVLPSQIWCQEWNTS